MIYVSLNSSSFQTIRPKAVSRSAADILQLMINMVQITPWNPDDRVHIDEVYTNLSWLRDHKTPRGTSQKKLKDYGEIFQGTDRFPNPKRILIYGRPGIGKTTFSQKIASTGQMAEKKS